MNIEYLNSLPEIENKYNVQLEENEKVVFVAELSTFGTEKDRVLGGYDSKFTLTNRRIIADNNVGFWTINIADDIVECRKNENKFLIFKTVYFSIELNTQITYGNGEKLTGFHFYFKKEYTNKFEEIMSNVFNLSRK